MTTRYFFVEPLDVLKLRGNRSFGAAGEHGEALLPPWPSVFAGAFRSAMLADDAHRLSRFTALAGANFDADGESERSRRMAALLGSELFASLGTPQRPGAFRISWASLARLEPSAQPLWPLPADLMALDAHMHALTPGEWPALTQGSALLPMTALLRSAKAAKPEDGHWLTGAELSRHLSGQQLASSVKSEQLFKRETRLGIGIDAASRTASDGALYTTEAIALKPAVGFLIGIAGADPLADAGLLRLGGDGHGARWRQVDYCPPPAPAITQGGRFRLLLSTPGLFDDGWLPTGVERSNDGSLWLRGDGFSARLACAALPRHGVVSGWDLAHWAPKPAQRVAPAGSVYWFDRFKGDAGKLASWVAGGLWPQNVGQTTETAQGSTQRCAEGFNNALLGAWL